MRKLSKQEIAIIQKVIETYQSGLDCISKDKYTTIKNIQLVFEPEEDGWARYRINYTKSTFSFEDVLTNFFHKLLKFSRNLIRKEDK